LLWTNPEAPDKKDCKGVESVRRDSCQLVWKMVDKVLEIILYEKNFAKAVNYCKGKVFDLLNNWIDLSDLILTKSISKSINGEDDNGYVNP
jgi:DNA polymerase delta subunit 1